LIGVSAALVELVRVWPSVSAGDFHPEASMAGGEGFSGRDKSGADTSSACSVRDDQGCDSAPGAVAFEERTDMDGDDGVEIALGVGHVGRAGRVVDPGLLSAHGAKYGLCQIYSNESWHYELRPQAIDRGCPPMYADPTHDPRMQQ
jgi:hypothetical protein